MSEMVKERTSAVESKANSTPSIQPVSGPHHKFLRLTEVRKRVPLSRSSIYRGVIQGTFPAQYRLGPNSSAWLESEIDAWILSRLDNHASMGTRS